MSIYNGFFFKKCIFRILWLPNFTVLGWLKGEGAQSRLSAKVFLQSLELGLPHSLTRMRERGWGVPIPTRGFTLWYSYMYFVRGGIQRHWGPCFISLFTKFGANMESKFLKGTQAGEFFWLRFWILYYFIVSYVQILRFCKKNFLIGPLLGEIQLFRLVWD